MVKKKKSNQSQKSPPAQMPAEAPGEDPSLAADNVATPSVFVVGVGASAGGLDTFSLLLRSLPDVPNLALVFVQHLSPQYSSLLATILANSTNLPVVQIRDDTDLEANRIYVIPPNRHLELRQGKLLLLPRPEDASQYKPVDAFFRSLAEEQSPAVGVILSGNDSDGVEGLHAIKAAGGIVIAQDPSTARFDGMPSSAVATGKVDYILPVEEIGPLLERLARERPLQAIRPRMQGDEMRLEPHQLDQIFSLLKGASGVDFAQYKLPTLQRRIQRRMALNKLISADHFIKYLRENPAEIHQLYQDVLINVTRFFREPESFQALANEVFSRIVDLKRGDAPLRIWVPACSTGEEPYSVAISLFEFLGDETNNVSVQIFATDISESAIDQARAGIYPLSIADDVSAERLRRFFTKTDGNYRINKSIRDQCIFARQDLTRDPPFSKLDLIVCRNVLIYLGQPIQKKLMSIFHYALKPTGYLMLGSAESIGTNLELFSVADKKHRIFKKKLVDMPADMHFRAPSSRRSAEPLPRMDENRFSGTAQTQANQVVLDRFAPPGVIVDENLQIVQFRGQTGLYLEPAPGDASLNLLKMCREGLLYGLRTAFQSVKKKDTPVRKEGLRIKFNGGYRDIALEVIPLTNLVEGRHYLVLFQDATADAAVPKEIIEPDGRKTTPRENHRQELERLQKELIASREYLQSIIQDLEAANEELQSANEEILSSNEELQSTNEELDTAKEELQSTNEELNTLNEELHGRNEELGRINSDLINLLNSVQIAIVIVDGHLRIRRFTPMAERVLNLISGDIGRPISQIKPNIDCPDLEKLINEVIETMTIHQRDVRDAQGQWFSLTIRPYKNVDNRIDGAVLALYDLNKIRRQEAEAQSAREFAEALLAIAHEPIIVLDDKFQVKTFNQAFADLFQVTLSEAIRTSFLRLARETFNTTEVQALLQDQLERKSAILGVEIALDLPAVGLRTVRLNARKLAGPENSSVQFILAAKVGESQKNSSVP